MEERSNFDHYVAQHYLKLFTNDQNAAFVGDVIAHSVERHTDFRSIMGRPNWSVDQSIEDGFTAIETKVASAMRTLSANPRAATGLSVSTALALRAYICMHYARSVGVHDAMNQSTEQFMQELARTAPPGFDVNSLGLRDATRPESLLMGIQIADYIEVAIRMKGCIALIGPGTHQFIVGDNPLSNLSSQDSFMYRGGLPNRDTYLWFPLNPKLGLLFIYQTGNILGEGNIKIAYSNDRLTRALNLSEAFLASQYIVGKSHGVVKGLTRCANVGEERAKVTSLDWAPLTINENKAVATVDESLIDFVRQQIPQ